MAIRSGFFNSVNGDRKYDASRFAEYFASFIGNGVFPQPNNNLQVIANNDMTVTIKAGKAWINGYILINDDDYILEIDPADGVLNRIDRIVARYDVVDREIRLEVKKGTFASNPVAPALQRDSDAYELALADIYVGAGVLSITEANITDLRDDSELCGKVYSLIAGDIATLADKVDELFTEIDYIVNNIATKAEAEDGTNNTKFMTPLRVKEVIDVYVPAIITGSRSVSGGATTTINLGFSPRYVIAYSQQQSNNFSIYAALLDGQSFGYNSTGRLVLTRTSSGFTIQNTSSTSQSYNYLAIK